MPPLAHLDQATGLPTRKRKPILYELTASQTVRLPRLVLPKDTRLNRLPPGRAASQ